MGPDRQVEDLHLNHHMVQIRGPIQCPKGGRSKKRGGKKEGWFEGGKDKDVHWIPELYQVDPLNFPRHVHR